MNSYQFLIENQVDIIWENRTLTLRTPRETLTMKHKVKDIVVFLQLKDYNNSRADTLAAGIEQMKIKLEEMKDEQSKSRITRLGCRKC